MPGILIMNQNGAEGATGDRNAHDRDRNAAVSAQDPRVTLNGDRNPSQLDGPSQGHGATSVNGALTSSPTQMKKPASMLDMPPEIRHITDNFQPFSKILSRTSQECFNGLTELLTQMAEMPVAQQPNGPLTNGVGGHAMANGVGNTSANNVRKKVMLLKFAEDQRTKFIKLLVLSQWSRRAEEVSKLIDIVNWSREQSAAFEQAVFDMANIKNDMADAKLPNPDIRTALEILSTGKDPRIPDLGYIPAEPISAQRALKVLGNLNTQLSIRLNLHEELPRHLKNWNVASGRATFVIPSEFEFDVSSYSEDTSSPWWFIDLRLLFSPAPEIPTESQSFIELDRIANHTLATSGLSGCFDFFHNFVLTHKIAVLKAQALELLAANWTGSLEVYSVHRFLCVQYWLDVPGKKNWIEIGIASGKPKNGKVSWRGPTPSYLTARWFRQGVEVTDTKLDFDWKDLSMERMLRKVIALHISHIFESTRDQLLTSVRESSDLQVKAKLSDSEPSDCALEASLGHSDNTTTASVDPITGKFALRPCNSASIRQENEINRTGITTDISAKINQLLCTTLQDRINGYAQQLGWTNVKGVNVKSEQMKNVVTAGVTRWSIFRGPGWSSKCALGTFINPSGVRWWILEIRQDSRGTPVVSGAEQISLNKNLPISRKLLGGIEDFAVCKISFSATARELTARNVPSVLRKVDTSTPVSSASGSANVQRGVRGFVLYIKTAALLEQDGSSQQSWIHPGIRVTHHGVDSTQSNVVHIVQGTMVKNVDLDMRKLMSASSRSDVEFGEKGEFTIILRTPFGEQFADQLVSRLRDIERLRSFVSILHKRKLKCEESSLEKVVFRYNAVYTATVLLGAGSKISLKLDPSNPHNRIRIHLTELLNRKSSTSSSSSQIACSGLDGFTQTLLFTVPLLRCLNFLQDAIPGNLSNPSIHAHGVTDFRLTYSNPTCSFDITFKSVQDETRWLIEDNMSKNPDNRPAAERSKEFKRKDDLAAALKAFFRSKGNGWIGIRTGIVAEVEGVSEALTKLHELVRRFAVEGQDAPKEIETTTTVTANTNSNANAGDKAAKPQQTAASKAQANGARKGNPKDIITID